MKCTCTGVEVFPLGDEPNPNEMRDLGLEPRNEADIRKVYAVKTGEVLIPQVGQWYLAWDVTAFRKKDSYMYVVEPLPIMKLVKVKLSAEIVIT